MIQAIRGTYDLLPADAGIWHAIDSFEHATLLARRWSQSGKRVYLDFDARSLKSQMRLADKLMAKSVIIIGEDELKNGMIVLTDMATKEQRNIREEEFIGKV